MAIVSKTRVTYMYRGKEYDTLAEAEAAERDNAPKAEKWKRESYSYQGLMKKYSPNEYGVWHVRGEDSNADFGGHHHMPTLGYVEGHLNEVVEWAVAHNRFFAWGAGGDISKVDIIKLKWESR